jgi:hypothetical protein
VSDRLRSTPCADAQSTAPPVDKRKCAKTFRRAFGARYSPFADEITVAFAMAIGVEVEGGIIMARSAWENGMDATGCGCATVAPTERHADEPWGGSASPAALGVRAIEELEWFGAALNRPRRLSRELIALARGLVARLVEERLGAARLVEARSASEAAWVWSGHAPQRVLAAAAFAVADAPQWPWFLRVHHIDGRFEAIPREAWWRSADCFAAWAFGVSLPRVRTLTARLREEPRGIARHLGGGMPDLASDRWIVPCIRNSQGGAATEDLRELAMERALRAEAER